MMVVQRWVQRRVQQRIAVIALHNARRSAGIVRAPRGYYCYGDAKTHWETSNQQPAAEFTDLYGSTGVVGLILGDTFSRAKFYVQTVFTNLGKNRASIVLDIISRRKSLSDKFVHLSIYSIENRKHRIYIYMEFCT